MMGKMKVPVQARCSRMLAELVRDARALVHEVRAQGTTEYAILVGVQVRRG